MKNQLKYSRFAEILSGKVDFKNNIIYLRDLTPDGNYEINLEIFIEIRREETNLALVRIRPKQDIPN